MPNIAEAAPRGSRPKASNAPCINVHIDGHFTSKVYTCGSTIRGHVAVKATRDTAFNSFEIIFTGISFTRMDFVQQYATQTARPFLRLSMPLREEHLPTNNVFTAGQTHNIPFEFVVPHQLTLGACQHDCVNNVVREHHLRLLPSMGNWVDDDQAPNMAQIEYSIRACALRGGSKVLEGHQTLRMIPHLPEDAPLEITENDERYCLTKAKTIRKNLMTSKMGKMTVKTSQPGAVMLAADAYSMTGSSLRLNLEFEPTAADVAPPKINSVSTKLQSTTFFGIVPKEQLPNLGSRDDYRTNQTLTYSTHTNVAMPALGKVQWAQKRPANFRRDSGYGSYSETEPSESGPRKKEPSCNIRHASTIDIPFGLPASRDRFFLPTFHSCFISRTYTLRVSMSVGPLNTTISLAIPLQIAVEMKYPPRIDDDLPTFERAIAEAEEENNGVDSYFHPRMLQMAEVAFSRGELPGYEQITRQRAVAVA